MQFHDQFHSEQTPIRIIHVGAGAAGLIAAYQAQKLLANFELVVYEKNSDIGGTWCENRYPGCGCDVPAHCYTFSFEPNPDWSGFYVPAAEIKDYLTHFRDKYELASYIQLETTVLTAEWDDVSGEWIVELERADGTRFTDRANVVINGSGPLNKWKWPTIPNRDAFKGTITHSAAWSDSYDWKGKRVGVIGCGASGVQLIPELVEGSESLVVFAREMQWIAAPLGLKPEIRVPGVPEANSGPPGPLGKHRYTEAERESMAKDPGVLLQYRKSVEHDIQRFFGMFLRDSPERAFAMQMMEQNIRARFGEKHQELADGFIPNFSPGCRRVTPAEGFIEALIQDHVSVQRSGIESFTEQGVRTVDGQEYELDLIVCCTGFDVAYTPHFPIKGRNGVLMKEQWAAKPSIYLTMATPNFPNFFHIGGPTGNWSVGSILVSHEVQAEYCMQACRKISAERLHSIAPKQTATDQYMAYSAAWHSKFSVWSENCRSWYKNGGTVDGEIMQWCGSMLHLLKTLKAPRWEDYEVRYREDNMWTFLGALGRTELETLSDRGVPVDLTPFVRLSDEPWTIE